MRTIREVIPISGTQSALLVTSVGDTILPGVALRQQYLGDVSVWEAVENWEAYHDEPFVVSAAARVWADPAWLAGQLRWHGSWRRRWSDWLARRWTRRWQRGGLVHWLYRVIRGRRGDT